MPRTAFPLSKSATKAYRLGNRRWRVVTFDARGANFRLLLNYSPSLEQYQAMLGLIAGHDTKVIASYERHPTHKGWHVHAACGDLSAVPLGIKRGPWVRNLEKPIRVRDEDVALMTDDMAYMVARRFFRLDKAPPFELTP